MKRYVIAVSYDGTHFNGSQIQGNQPTVQLALNTTLSTILRANISTYGASRTDEGVHAISNFYQFDYEPEIKCDLLYKCNAVLPFSISIKKIFIVDSNFNVRFDAISRTYRYKIYTKKNPFLYKRALYFAYPINIQLLHQLAKIITEYQHFESFSKRNTQSKTFICTIMQSYWETVGEELHYVVEANRFLRGMVRGLVGTQLQIARKNGTCKDFRNIIEANNCELAYFNVEGFGLYLEKITYNTSSFQNYQ